MILKYKYFITESQSTKDFEEEIKDYLDIFKDEDMGIEATLDISYEEGDLSGKITIESDNDERDPFSLTKDMIDNLENILNIIKEYYTRYKISLLYDGEFIGSGLNNLKGNIHWSYDYYHDKSIGKITSHNYKYLHSIQELTNLDIRQIDLIKIQFNI